MARTWGKTRCDAIEHHGALNKHKVVPLNLYFEDHDLWGKTGRTKRYVIKMLMDCDNSKVRSDSLKTSDLIEHCKNRRAADAGPSLFITILPIFAV